MTTENGMMRPPAASPQILRQAGVLLLAAVIPAVLAAGWHPLRPAWSRDQALVPEVAWATVQDWRGQVLFVDARSADAYARRHIPGALSLRLGGGWEGLFQAVVAAWRPGARVVVYCDDKDCEASQSVARRLRRELGVGDVFVLKGGWSAWLKAQKPLG
ncbi:MAG TPA: rhodanese-like domain-containing protein [Opitutaceae bacterium]|nr:rhodanese-like domain-containing protein [Opitutaceae bacterium]